MDAQDDAKKTAAEKEAEEKRKAEEALAVFEQAQADAKAAQSMLGALPGLAAELSAYYGPLAEADDAVKAAQDALAPLEKARRVHLAARLTLALERDGYDKQRAEALYGLIVTDERIARTESGGGLVSVVVGTSNATEAESDEYLLARVASTHAQAKEAAEAAMAAVDAKIVRNEEQIADLSAQIAEAKKVLAAAQKGRAGIAEAGNALAFEIEKIASEARQASREAINALGDLDDEVEGVPEMKEVAHGWDLRLDGTRAEALDAAGSWYDAVDALGGLEDGISYGCGLDFALDEEEFVAKWGPAIDAFYVAYGAPLAGYGKDMALQAYRYHVDPRLCAAVSIVESSGGAYCIKPHNAWGWGAADSDPYNLAFGWDSWESAIESWHVGMATSQSGLATAPSLTGMGDIYCSTPIWGSKVANLMEQISSYA